MNLSEYYINSTWNDISKNDNFTNYISLEDIYEKYIPELYVIPRYIKSFLYLFGFPGNIIACILWLQKPLLHSSGCYLAALAISDLIFLMLSLIYDLHNKWNIKILNFTVICKLFPMMYLIVQYLSPLLTLAFTVERFISIRFPFKRRVYCSIRRALVVISLLSIVAVAIASIQIHFWEYIDIEQKCQTKQELDFLWMLWTWATESTMFMLIPILILIFNIIVIFTIKTSKRRARELYGSVPPKHRTATTKMLLVVSFFFIFTTLPVSIVYSLFVDFPIGNSQENIENDPVWTRHFQFVVAREVIYDLGMMHYVFNFYLYLATGKKFRQTIKKFIKNIAKNDSLDRSNRSLQSSITELRTM